MLAIDTAPGFLAALMAAEHGLALLDAGRPDAALAVAGHSAQIVTRAAAMLSESGDGEAARAALETGLALDGAPAPLQLALARTLYEAGEGTAACRRYRAALLRARPDASLLVELAVAEQAAGDSRAAGLMLVAAHALPGRDHDAIRAGAERLRAAGRADLALAAFALAHRRGSRSPALYDGFGTLLAARPDMAPIAALLDDPAIRADATLRDAALTMAGWGQLAVATDRAALLDAAAARERSDRWVSLAALGPLLRDVVDRRQPFSWVRLGDGEGRFLLHADPALAGLLPEPQAQAEAAAIWRNWTGASLPPANAVRDLGAALRSAAAGADLLGVTPHVRLAHDHYHFPYCATVERFVDDLPPSARALTSANNATELAEQDAFFASILGGLDWLGVISPHADLAGRLQARLGIGGSQSWVLPGETRLGQPAGEPHYPGAYDRIMAGIDMPRPGAVFLVAGGLFGKLFCARVRQLGGIALDIGAVADAWMGFNTRGTALDRLVGDALPCQAGDRPARQT